MRRRKLLGVDQFALSEICGISVHTLSNIESGKGNPTLEVLARLVEALGLEVKIEIKDNNES